MRYTVKLEQQIVRYNGHPVHVMSKYEFPTVKEACEFVDDSRKEGEAGDVIKRYTNETLIEQWTVR